jgi:hypothetical protein
MTKQRQTIPPEAYQQLKRAFEASHHWADNRRYRDPLNGFGRGEEWGEEVLERFMPAWFESWFTHENWLRSFLLGTFDEWMRVVEAFGYCEDKWYGLMGIVVPCYLSHHNITLEACEKPAVGIYHGNEIQVSQ